MTGTLSILNTGEAMKMIKIEGRLLDAVCDWCGEKFQQDDIAITMPHIGTPGKTEVWMHRECMIRSVAGCVEHQLHHGICDMANPCEDDPKLTRHQAARAAYDLWRATTHENRPWQ